jgi:hypothetical protein
VADVRVPALSSVPRQLEPDGSSGDRVTQKGFQTRVLFWRFSLPTEKVYVVPTYDAIGLASHTRPRPGRVPLVAAPSCSIGLAQDRLGVSLPPGLPRLPSPVYGRQQVLCPLEPILINEGAVYGGSDYKLGEAFNVSEERGLASCMVMIPRSLTI